MAVFVAATFDMRCRVTVPLHRLPVGTVPGSAGTYGASLSITLDDSDKAFVGSIRPASALEADGWLGLAMHVETGMWWTRLTPDPSGETSLRNHVPHQASRSRLVPLLSLYLSYTAL